MEKERYENEEYTKCPWCYAKAIPKLPPDSRANAVKCQNCFCDVEIKREIKSEEK